MTRATPSEQVRREATLYRRSARLRAWVDARDDQTRAERRRTLHATVLAGRLHQRAGQLSTARAIDALWSALEALTPDHPAYADIQRAHTTLTNPMPPPDPAEVNVTGWPPRLAALYAIEAALSADDLPAGVRGELDTARTAVMRPMRLAIPLTEVRAYVEHQLARAERSYERGRDGTPTPDPRNPEWSTIWTRYVWLYWIELKALRRAERAGVGAVLALDHNETLLEQLALLGEQLHWQGRIDEVPRDVTQDAVEPYWTAATALSASAEGWRWRQDQDALARRIREKRERERAEINRLCQPGNEAEYREAARRQSEGVVGFRWHPGLALRRRPIVTAQDIELALHRLLDRFGGPSRQLPGFEAVHRHTRDAAGSLRNWRVLRALEETDARDLRDQLDQDRKAAHAAVEAARVAGADTAADLEQIAADIDELFQRQTGEKSHD